MPASRKPGPLPRFFWPPSKLGRAWIIVFSAWLLLWPFSAGAGSHSASDIQVLLLMVLVVLSIPIAIRYTRQKLLWKLRNRLIINYLLIGLAPFVLLATLFLLFGYSLAGQFAIVATTGELDRRVNYLSTENRAMAMHVIHDMGKGTPLATTPEGEPKLGASHTTSVYLDDKFIPLDGVASSADLGNAPPWAQGSFSGVVDDNHRLFLRAVDTLQLNGHTATVISSEPLAQERLGKMGEGIGRVTLLGGVGTSRTANDPDLNEVNKELQDGDSAPSQPKTQPTPQPGSKAETLNYNIAPGARVQIKSSKDGPATETAMETISGGSLPPPAGLYDINVTFLTLLPVRDWKSGQAMLAPLSVSSRPSALYHRLFAISNEFGNIIRIALISLAIMFTLIELVALIMAARLNRTITKSVADLYEATVRVDAGDLSHQIEVKRNDQLSELSRSFNRMTSSLQRLIEEQKEKERMQGELAIAQEVQNNLFPHIDVRLPGLEVHGVCRPARTVSGDYYDFLLFGENSIGLALGDISGKGISAALLMATLHSAVRAYRFATEELVNAEQKAEVTRAPAGSAYRAVDYSEIFQSPARILCLLNRHLFRSTQPEKYATLWLAHYDGADRRLTYSNGGQLPPLVLRGNNEITRLDCGGTVVGLLDGMDYEEGCVHLEPGDIVVAYSDGVTEPENDFGDFGEDRLMELVRRYRTEPLAVISAQVMAALDDWIGAQEQPDDITLVLARQI